MKRMFALSAIVFAVFAFIAWPTSAFAQTSTGLPAGLPPVTVYMAVVTLGSFLIGAGTQLKQSGKLFGQKPLSPQIVTVIGIVLPFIGGALAVIKGAGAINASVVFYAVVAGASQMFTSGMTGFAVHAHLVVPGRLLALKKEAK